MTPTEILPIEAMLDKVQELFEVLRGQSRSAISYNACKELAALLSALREQMEAMQKTREKFLACRIVGEEYGEHRGWRISGKDSINALWNELTKEEPIA